MERNLFGQKFKSAELWRNLSQDLRAIFVLVLVSGSIVFMLQMASLDSKSHVLANELAPDEIVTQIELLDEIFCAFNQGESYLQCVVRDRN